jgi:hypothetical protein
MSLAEARGVLETTVATERLNYRDDLWTIALASPNGLSAGDRDAAISIGREMLESLSTVRRDVGPVRVGRTVAEAEVHPSRSPYH